MPKNYKKWRHLTQAGIRVGIFLKLKFLLVSFSSFYPQGLTQYQAHGKDSVRFHGRMEGRERVGGVFLI